MRLGRSKSPPCWHGEAHILFHTFSSETPGCRRSNAICSQYTRSRYDTNFVELISYPCVPWQFLKYFFLILGQLYHKPLRDSHGTVVISCVSGVRSGKSVSALNCRWAPVNKLRRRVLSDDNTMGELLMASVYEQIAYHQVRIIFCD